MYRSFLACFIILLTGINVAAQTTQVDTTKVRKAEFPISGSAQVSTLLKSGDVDATVLNGDLLLKTLTGSVEHFLQYNYERISNQESGAKVEHTIQHLQYQMRFPLLNRVKGIAGGEIEDNGVRDITYRYLGYAGIRVSVIQKPDVTLAFSTAGGYSRQKFSAALGGLSETFPIFYSGSDFSWSITDVVQFVNSNNYFIEFANQTEQRLLGSTSLKSRISKVLSFTFQFEYDYSSRTFDALAVSEQNDPWNLTLSAGIEAKF